MVRCLVFVALVAAALSQMAKFALAIRALAALASVYGIFSTVVCTYSAVVLIPYPSAYCRIPKVLSGCGRRRRAASSYVACGAGDDSIGRLASSLNRDVGQPRCGGRTSGRGLLGDLARYFGLPICIQSSTLVPPSSRLSFQYLAKAVRATGVFSAFSDQRSDPPSSPPCIPAPCGGSCMSPHMTM